MDRFFKSESSSATKTSVEEEKPLAQDETQEVPSIDNIITKLTEIRVSNYSPASIKNITALEYPYIKDLVVQLGNEILTANMSSLVDSAEAKVKCARAIEALFETSHNEFAIAFFSAQLLQYFTIVCDENFIASTNLQQFHQFLTENVEKFGTVDDNLFVVEYQLIKIFNDLNTILDAKTGKIAPISNEKAQINFILEQLVNSKLKVDKWLAETPKSIFIHYLSFALNYSCAKALEIQSLQQKQSSQEEPHLSTADSQKVFLHAAQKSLSHIERLNQSSQENETPLIGAEFSLGQNVLIKIPVPDLTLLSEHVASLMI